MGLCGCFRNMRALSVAVFPPVLGPVMVTTLVSGFTQTSIGTGSGARSCRASSTLVKHAFGKTAGNGHASDTACYRLRAMRRLNQRPLAAIWRLQ